MGGGYEGNSRGGKGRGRDSRSPPPARYDRGPSPRGYDRGPSPRSYDRGPSPRGYDRGPSPRRGRDEGPPRRGGYEAPRVKGGRGRGQDSRSPPPRGGDYGGKGRQNESRSLGQDDRSSRYSPPPRQEGHDRGGKGKRRESRSPPRNRSEDRFKDGKKRDWLGPPRTQRSRSRSRQRVAEQRQKKDLGYDPYFRIPPPKKKEAPPAAPSNVEMTPEMKSKSFEFEGYLYATIDFTAPQTPCGITAIVPKAYDGQKLTDPSWIPWNRMPRGWSLVPADLDQSIRDKVIAPFDWGTHLLIVDKGGGYLTQAGKPRGPPGGMQMIWDLEKGPSGLKLQKLKGSHAYWHGRLFIRTQVQ